VRQPAQPAQRHPGFAGAVRRTRRMGHQGHRTAAALRPGGRQRHRRHGRECQDAGGAGLRCPPRANQIVPPVDWVDPPVRIDNVYGALVCAVDTDGNEVAGIRLPPIAVPLGTCTGWNVYRAQPNELADRDGSFIPFAQTKAAREETGDPRPSLEERYGKREAYVAKIKAAAEALVAERLLLPSDAAAYVVAAKICDRF
jgi:hypothetical protein